MSRTRKDTIMLLPCGPIRRECDLPCWNGPWEGWISTVVPKLMVGNLHAVWSDRRPTIPAETYTTMWMYNYRTLFQGIVLVWVPSPLVEEREEFLL